MDCRVQCGISGTRMKSSLAYECVLLHVEDKL